MLTISMLTHFTPLAGTELFEDKGLLMAVITASGIIIVFVILLLLIFIFYAYGGIFRAVTASREKKAAAGKAEEDASKAPSTEAAAPAASVTPAAPSDNGEIPGEIIAVIAAAVAVISGDGKRYAVKKVTRAQRETGRRTAWAAYGVYENTRPF